MFQNVVEIAGVTANDRELRESGPVKEKKVLSLKKTPGFANYPL